MRRIASAILLLLLLTACGVPDSAPLAQSAPTATVQVAEPTQASPAPAAETQPAAIVTATRLPLTATSPPTSEALLTPATTPAIPETPMPSTKPGNAGQSSPSAVPSRPVPSPASVPTPVPPVTGEAPSDLLDRIIADVMQQTGVERQAVVIVRDEAVVWPDGSLGCPQPGLVYPQVLIDGYRVVAQVGDTVYDYRVDDRGRFRLCETPGSMLPEGNPSPKAHH